MYVCKICKRFHQPPCTISWTILNIPYISNYELKGRKYHFSLSFHLQAEPQRCQMCDLFFMTSNVGKWEAPACCLIISTRILRSAMSHLHCAFTLRAEWKHQFDTDLVKIHLVVHKIKSVIYFSLFLVIEILAFWQNWTRKQEVGHCDLILQPIFFHLIILKRTVPLMLHTKYQPNIPCHSGKKLIL